MKTKLIALISLTVSFSACSMGSVATPVAAVGTVLGAGLGAVTGGLIASTDKDYDKGKTIAVGAASGAAMGLIAGAMINDHNEEVEKARPIVREPKYTDNPVQREIDAIRSDMRDSTSYGRGEVRPWNERYQEAHSLPYQGAGASR